MNVVVCAYRDWALRVLPTVAKHPRVKQMHHVTNNEELYAFMRDKATEISNWVVLFCGWSTPPSEAATNFVPMFSEHPATSDRYSPGTPLQNQILDGVRYTKHRLVKVGYPELSPRQWTHEVDMDLSGNMDDILGQMEATSKQLFNMFLDDYPNVNIQTWPELLPEEQVRRRSPDMSKLEPDDFWKNTKQLYDIIRCLEAPYPNAFIEDEYGTLYFERVRFKAK
jgi:hypothetical protein